VSEQNETNENGTVNESANIEKTETEKLQAEVEKWKNDFLYLRAEFENYKRHAIKERSDLLKYAGERLAKDLLGIVDNFERALSVEVKPDTLETYVKGVDMTSKELKSVLDKHGIKAVNSENQPFDPSIHEALGSEATTQVPDGYVLRVFEKPYKYHDKILRIGRVIVAQNQKQEV
jgi:molecular chaperone GrpE